MPLLTNTYTKNVSARLPGDQARERVLRLRRDVQPAADDEHVQQISTKQPDQPPFLADHGEDEIGRALRQELELRLAAVHVALAEHAARADRDLRLDGVIAGAERVGLRIEEREHALPLIVVQEVPDDRHGADDERAQPEDVAQLQARRAGPPASPPAATSSAVPRSGCSAISSVGTHDRDIDARPAT